MAAHNPKVMEPVLRYKLGVAVRLADPEVPSVTNQGEPAAICDVVGNCYDV
jgi:hypothetical protein